MIVIPVLQDRKLQSLLPLPRKTVMERCKIHVDSIDEYRKREHEKQIEERVRSSERSFFRRLFRQPATTREQAISYLQDRSVHFLFTPWDDVEMLYGGQYNLCERIYDACTHTSEPVVYVTPDDWDTIR
jgi:hypothetical protein